MRKPKFEAVVLLAGIVMFTAAPAYAYVDPGTGGMLVQLVTGGLAGLAVLARLYYQRIKSSLKQNRRHPNGDFADPRV